MKIEDVWKNSEAPDIRGINPNTDVKRKAWYHEIKVIEHKMKVTAEKLGAQGKIFGFRSPGFERENYLEFNVHQGPMLFFEKSIEGKKILNWFQKLEDRRKQLSEFLLKDLDVRGPPYLYKKEQRSKK